MTLDKCDISIDEYKREPLKYLPHEVVSLYSGDEKRLYNYSFSKWEEKYNKANQGQESAEVLRMLYVSSKHWNIFGFLLNVYNSSKEDEMLLKNMGCFGIKEIEIDFNIENLKSNNNVLVKSIIEVINPASQASIKLNKKEDIQALIDKLNAFGALELYTNLNLCFNPEYIIIKNFNITFDADYNIEKMSEGNKKLILLNGIYKFLAGKNSLVLLDEPDTYLHESRKGDVIDVVQKYDVGYTLLTTHSSVLISKLNVDNVMMAIQTPQGVQIKNSENLRELLSAVGDFNTITTINGIIESNKPILMLEGQDDVNYFNSDVKDIEKKNKDENFTCE